MGSEMCIRDSKYILPYAAKRGAKIAIKYQPKEVKEYNEKYKAFRKSIGKDE